MCFDGIKKRMHRPLQDDASIRFPTRGTCQDIPVNNACTILPGWYNNRSYADSDAQVQMSLANLINIFLKSQYLETKRKLGRSPRGNEVIINYFSYI